MNRKMLQKSLVLFLAQGLLATATMASPFDLVIYDEGKVGYYLAVEANQITLRLCPQDAWIESAAQCAAPANLMPVDRFESVFRNQVLEWAAKNPNKDLTPLKAADLAILRASGDMTGRMNQLNNRKSELATVENMLSHLPNSQVYQDRKKTISQEVANLEAGLAQYAPVEKLFSDLTKGVFALIATNNPKDGKINNYARSQMKNSLLSEVMDGLLGIAPVGDAREYIRNASLFDGAHGSLKYKVNGWAHQLYIDGKFTGNVRDDNDEAVNDLANRIRKMKLTGQW